MSIDIRSLQMLDGPFWFRMRSVLGGPSLVLPRPAPLRPQHPTAILRSDYTIRSVSRQQRSGEQSMALLITLVLTALVGLLTAALLFYTWHFNYWKKRHVPYYNPTALTTLLSSGFRSLPLVKPFWKTLEDVYALHKDKPYTGFFQARRPALVVRDPEIIKLVLTKEFSSFHDRGVPYDEEDDPLGANLFSLEGEKWKHVRTKLSPTFTSGKMKIMFQLMSEVSDELKVLLRESAEKQEEVEFQALLLRYCTDIIGTCAFGISCNSLKDPESHFYKMGREVSSNNFIFLIRITLLAISPKFGKLIPFKSIIPNNTNFFLNLMKETVEFREKNGVARNDMVQLMMQLRDSDQKPIRFDEKQMAAEAFLFFIAGLDSVANTVGFCLHELALNEDLQRAAAAEVQDVAARHDGQLTYEAVTELDLVGRIIMEGLRKWSPASILTRVVTSPFRIPDSDLVLDEVPVVFVPVWELHHDPVHYPEPERFDPDRFTAEAKEARHPYVYLPFGEGPRHCIAQRFANLEMKLALASVLRDFHVTPGPQTEAHIQLHNKSISVAPKNGFWLNVQKRE